MVCEAGDVGESFGKISKGNEQKKNQKRKSKFDVTYTDDKIKFLCNLNRELKQIEKDIIERASALLEMAEKKLKEDAFTTDYEVEATVEYYPKNKDNPCYTCSESFSYQRTVVEKEYGMLLDNGNGTDWHREDYMPLLDKTYSFRFM